MAPLPPENTGRVWVDYVAQGRQHSMQVRYGTPGAPGSDLLEALDDVLIALNPFMPEDWAFVDARYAVDGSTVSIPLVFTPTSFDGGQPVRLSSAPAFLSLVGRDTLGKRVRLYALGTSFGPDEEGGIATDYRLAITENVSAAALYSAVASSPFTTITGSDPAWKPYLNLGYNSYWQRKVRG